jgi:hypothetical protein
LLWTDGKAVYQKTVAVAAGPNNSTVNVPHGITSFETVVDLECTLSDSTPVIINIPNVGVGVITAQCQFNMDGTNFVLISGVGGDYSAFSGHVTVRYTKP